MVWRFHLLLSIFFGLWASWINSWPLYWSAMWTTAWNRTARRLAFSTTVSSLATVCNNWTVATLYSFLLGRRLGTFSNAFRAALRVAATSSAIFTRARSWLWPTIASGTAATWTRPVKHTKRVSGKSWVNKMVQRSLTALCSLGCHFARWQSW